MKALKVSLLIVGIAVLALMASVQVLARYDRRTRENLLAIVARELPVGASEDQMTEFLRRHTSRFALDDRFHHVYGGFLPQSSIDKRLFDRQVQINLNLDSNQRFKEAQVNIYYTAL